MVLAEKGGIDTVGTRERYPRVAELPFDAAYKFMATFHRMTDDAGRDVVRCFVKGAPDQLLARGAHQPRPRYALAAADRRRSASAYLAENERLGEQGLRVMATGYKDFDAGHVRPARPTCSRSSTASRCWPLVGIDDPPRPQAKDGDRPGQAGRHAGAHDHRRPRGDGQGDRAQARHRGPRDHRRRVRCHERRRAARVRSTGSA